MVIFHSYVKLPEGNKALILGELPNFPPFYPNYIHINHPTCTDTEYIQIYIYIYTQTSITYTLYCIPIILPFGNRPGYANDTLVSKSVCIYIYIYIHM